MTIKREPAIKQTINKITQNLRQKVILGKKIILSKQLLSTLATVP